MQGNRLKSTDVMEIIQVKMKWWRSIIGFSFPFRSKDKLDHLRRMGFLVKLAKGSSKIQFRVDGRVINRDQVGTHELLMKSMERVTNGRMVNFGDKDAMQSTAGLKVKSERRDRSKIQGNSNHLELSEWSGRDVKIGEGNIIKIDHIQLVMVNTIQEMCIGRFVNKVMHNFIKGNMLRSLDSPSVSVIVENVLHGLGITKEDTDAGVRCELLRLMVMRWESIDMATPDMK